MQQIDAAEQAQSVAVPTPQESSSSSSPPPPPPPTPFQEKLNEKKASEHDEQPQHQPLTDSLAASTPQLISASNIGSAGSSRSVDNVVVVAAPQSSTTSAMPSSPSSPSSHSVTSSSSVQGIEPFEPVGDEFLNYDRYGELIQHELTNAEKKKEMMRIKKENRRADKWLVMISDWERWKKQRAKKIKSRVRKGIPDRVRARVWQVLVGSDSLAKRNPGVYQNLLRTGVTRFEDTIKRDLHRTFPNHEMFHKKDGLGQQCLFNVLKAFACFDHHIGYCQGMAFISALLLSYMTEEDVFWVLVQLFKNYNFDQLYSHGFPFMHECFYVLGKLIEERLPKLHRHFQEEGIICTLFAQKWFLTTFTYNLTFSKSIRLLDIFFYEGWKIIFRVGLSLLKRHENQILRLSFEQACNFIQHDMHKLLDQDEFIKLALQFKLYRRHIQFYANEFQAMQRQQPQSAPQQQNGKQNHAPPPLPGSSIARKEVQRRKK